MSGLDVASDAVRRVVILGGGTAGWITAGILAARYPTRGAEGLEISVVESSDRPVIGVGEGTWPTMRRTLKQIGVSETGFLRAYDATLNQGSRFDGWVDGTSGDSCEEVFPAESHQFVLYGMGFRPESATWLRDERTAVGARERIGECRRAGERLVQAMPTNRDLIGRILRCGLQKV